MSLNFLPNTQRTDQVQSASSDGSDWLQLTKSKTGPYCDPQYTKHYIEARVVRIEGSSTDPESRDDNMRKAVTLNCERGELMVQEIVTDM